MRERREWQEPRRARPLCAERGVQRAERCAALDDEARAARPQHGLDQLERAVDQGRVPLARAAGGAGERRQVGGG